MMFCPKCSQQQADGSRFCSRCGFPLAGVNELLAHGGQLPVYAMPDEPTAGPRPMSPRRKGVKQGGGMLMIGIFLIPCLAILHEAIGTPEEFVLFGVLVFLAGLLRMLYAAFFQEGAPKRPGHQLQQAYAPPVQPPIGATRYDALPPAHTPPAHAYRPPQRHTAEMRPPPSVTDHTTRLLERDADAEREER